MRPLPPFELPPDKRRVLQKARRLEIVSLVYSLSLVAVVGLVMGNSQAMRTAWIEDLITLVPPIAFLVGSRVARREPNRRFPYGYEKANTVVFLCSALALAALGVVLLVEGVVGLAKAERPSIGSVVIGGHVIWQGWLMIAAMAYGAPMILLGRGKAALACELHDKGLHTDGDMSRDDWFVAIAASLGVLGVAIGWWWADAVAAIVISLSVCRDGFRDLFESVRDLMDSAPTTVDHHDEADVRRRVEAEVAAIPWVAAVSVRLREQGQRLIGEVEVVAHDGVPSLDELEALQARACAVDWRLHALHVVPVRAL